MDYQTAYEGQASTAVNSDPTDQVPGFSARFIQLLDTAEFPKKGRYSVGAEQFDVSVNTFRSWCLRDKPPRKYGVLHYVVEQLLSKLPESYSPSGVVGWLYAGDAVPNPFQDQHTDYVLLGELYMLVQRLADDKGIDLEQIPRESRQLLINRAMAYIEKKNGDNRIDINDKALQLTPLVESMLELAQHELL